MKLDFFHRMGIALAINFIWTGFVSAISFMEAWLKFRAPNVTLAAGLSIGRLIFFALNKVEWGFFLFIFVLLVKSLSNIEKYLYLSVLFAILFIQTFFLMPILFERVDLFLMGIKPPSSWVHFYYLSLEIVKVAFLLFFGMFLFKNHFRLLEKEK